MARLSSEEKRQLLEAARRGDSALGAAERSKNDLLVKPTVATRTRYMIFAKEAARFYRGKKPVRFEGENWKL